ncbi:MAG: exonuclease domain-containing protein [Janthinobacterium lividum]
MSAYIFDTETTGASDPDLIEAAWLLMSDDVNDTSPRNVFLKRYKSPKRIEFGAMAVHHIIESDLTDCSPNSEFRLPIDMKYMIGHKVDFDWEVAGSLNVKRICTLAMAKRVWPTAESHTLGALNYMLADDQSAVRLELRDAHNALADCYLCARVLNAIIDHCDESLTTWEEVYQFSERARIPTHMSFGKHVGKPVADVPYDYRAWYARQPDPDPYLLKAFGLPFVSAAGAVPPQRSN